MRNNSSSIVKFVAALFWASVSLLPAQTFTNTGTGTANWSASTWTPSTPTLASGSSTTVLVFSGTLGAASTLTNNLGVFDLTTLTDSTGGFVRTIAGSQLNFTGTTNSINGNSTQGGIISAPINFTNGLTFTSGAFSAYTLSGTITGSGGLVKSGLNGSLTISGNNSYTGGTILNGNILTVTNNNGLGGASGGTLRINAGTLSAPGRTLANNIEINSNIGLIDSNNNGNITLSGAVDLLGGTRTLTLGGTVAAASTVTISGVISNGGIVKNGVSLLKLTGANTYTGGTTINNGVLQFSQDTNIPTTGSILINNGGALAVNSGGGTVTVQGWLNDGRIDAASSGIIAMNGSSALAIDFSSNGGYNLFLGALANSTLTGALTPNGVTYRLGGGGATLTLSNSNALTGSNTLLVGPALSVGAIGSTQVPTQTTSGGTVALSNSNSMTGDTTVQSGTLSLTGATGAIASSDVTLRAGATLNFAPSTASSVTRVKSATLNGGTLSVTGPAFATTDTITNAVTLNSGANTLTVTPNATGSNTLSAASLGRTAGTGWAFVNGLNLGKDSTTTSNVGRITFGTDPTLVGTTAALTTGINSGAQNTQIVPWLVGAVTATTGGTGTASAAANTFLTYNASTGLRPLNLTDEFTNNAITSGNNTYITANTTGSSTGAINSLALLAANASTPTLSLNNGVTLTVTSGALLFTPTTTNSANAATIQATSGSATLAFGTAEAIITVQNPTTSNTTTGTISTDITGSGGLSKFGTGTLVLTGAKSYTGVTTLNSGILSTNSLADGGSSSGIGASSSAASNLILTGGGLTYTGAAVSTDRLFSVGLAGGAILSSGTGGITFTNTGSIGFNGESGARILTLGGTGAFTNTLAALIADNGGPTSVVKAITGSTWVLSNTNTYTGSTQLLGDTNNVSGTISISSIANGGVASGIGASTSDASNLIINRGSLQYTGAAASTDRLFTIGNNGGTLDASGSGALNFTNSGKIAFTAPFSRTLTLTGTNTDDNTLSPVVSNSEDSSGQLNTAITKSGAGTWVLAGTNTYAGNTTVSLGTLKAGSTSAFGINSAVTMTNAAATNLDLNGFNVSIGSLAGGGTNGGNVLLGSATLTTGGKNADTSYAGVISGTGGSLTKTGSGTQTLTRANTYTGTTTVSNGTLLLSGSGSIANSTIIDVASGATLNVSGVTGGTYTFGSGQTLKGKGTIVGNLVLNGNFQPGNSPGLITTTGNLTLGSTATTTMEIANTGTVRGTDYDGADVSGLLTYGGTLTLSMSSLVANTTYNLFDFGSVSGNVASVVFSGGQYAGTFANTPSGFWTATDTNGSGQTFSFELATGDLTVVPEPATWLLLAGTGTFFLVMRRRRRI